MSYATNSPLLNMINRSGLVFEQDPGGSPGGDTPATPGGDGETPKSALSDPENPGDGGTPPAKPENTPADKTGENDPKPKKEDDPPAEETQPLTVDDLTVPEGIDVESEDFSSFLELVNDQSLSRTDLTNKLLGMFVDMNTASAEAAETAVRDLIVEQRQIWRKETEALDIFSDASDPMGQRLGRMKTALETVGGAGKEFFDALDITGAGDHPEVLKVLYRVTEHLQEKQPSTGNPSGTRPSAAEAMYPTMKQSGDN